MAYGIFTMYLRENQIVCSVQRILRHGKVWARDGGPGLKRHFEVMGVVSLLMAVLMLVGCASELVGDASNLEKLEAPTGIAIHPNGRYAYVTGSNFDLDYRASDGGALYVIDLETDQILPSSKHMGSFSGNVVLSSDGRHGYTVTREDDALVWFEISEDGSSVFCPKAKEDSNSLSKCRIILNDDPTHIAITRSFRESRVIDHQGVEHTKRVNFDLLMIAQQRNARVTAMTVMEDENGDLSFSHETASYVYSASEVLWLGGERFAVTGRAARNLSIISPAISADGKVLGLYANQTVNIPSGGSAYQGRGMTLDPLKKNLYLLNQYPKSLFRIDVTGLAKDDLATDKAQVSQMMLLPADMLKIAWIGSAEEGVLYLTSVADDLLYIVDPKTMEIIKTVELSDGPYDFSVQGDAFYVVNFLASTISKYDISDPLNPVLLKEYLKTADAAD